MREVSEGGSGSEWIAARALTAYTTIDGTSIPAARRKTYIPTVLRRWSPFPDPEWHVEWVGQMAMAWVWSSAAVRDADSDEEVAGPRGRAAKVVPETLFLDEPHEQAEVLVQVSDGMEGRVWRQQVLTACQWWPDIPTLEEWNFFRRGAGLPAADAVPDPLQSGWRSSPWSAQRSASWQGVASRHGPLAATAMLAAATAFAMFQFGSLARLWLEGESLEREIAKQDESAQVTLRSMERALDNALEVDRLLELRPPATQLELMSAIEGALPAVDWDLRAWRMPDPTRLEVDARLANPDPGSLVRSLEASPLLSDVVVELGRSTDELTLRATITPLKGATNDD